MNANAVGIGNKIAVILFQKQNVKGAIDVFCKSWD
jgi:hypothetical protein